MDSPLRLPSSVTKKMKGREDMGLIKRKLQGSVLKLWWRRGGSHANAYAWSLADVILFIPYHSLGREGLVSLCLVAQSCPTLCDPMNCRPPDCSVHGDSPGKNTGVGHHALLQGIFPTQGSNPGLAHCRQILHHLSHQGSSGQGGLLSLFYRRRNRVSKCKSLSRVQLFATHGYCPWDSPGQNTRVANCSLLQGIFPIQESNSGFPLCRQILFQLSHQGSWKKLRLNDKNNLLKLTQVGRSRTSSLNYLPLDLGVSGHYSIRCQPVVPFSWTCC